MTSSDPIPAQSHDLDLPPLDVAALEYLTDLAFDERLSIILDHTLEDISTVDGECETTYQPHPELLPYNRERGDDEPPTTKLFIRAKFTEGSPKKYPSFEASFVPDTFETKSIVMRKSADDGFDVFSSEDFTIVHMDQVEAASLVLLATGTTDKILRHPNANTFYDEATCTYIMSKVLINCGEATGHYRRERLVELNAPDSTDALPIKLRLGHESIESMDTSTLKIVIERAEQYPDLQAETAFRLVLKYSNVSPTTATAIDKTAQKHIRGDLMELRSAQFFATLQDGTQKELDAGDPEVTKMFINTYEAMCEVAARKSA